MHICKNCGKEFEGSFCPECGTRYEDPTCPECGAHISSDAKFCPSCGHAFGKSADSAEKTQKKPRLSFTKKREQRELTPEEKKVELANKTKTWLSRGKLLTGFFGGYIPGYAVLAVIIGVVTSFSVKFEEWNPGKLEKERKHLVMQTVGSGVFAAIWLVGGILIHVLALPAIASNPYANVFNILIPSLTWFCVLCELAGVIVGVLTMPIGKELVLDYYGKPDPLFETESPVVSVQELARVTAVAAHENSSKKSRDNVRLGALSLVVLYFLILAIAIPVSIFSDPFRADNVRKIRLGAEKYSVQSLLGDPHLSPMQTEPDERMWTYVSGNYADLEKKAMDLAEQEAEALFDGDIGKLDKLEEQLKALEEQAKSLIYKCIVVTFDGDGKVTSVCLDTHHCDDPESSYYTRYEDEDVKCSAKSCSSMEEFEALSVSVLYEDGSYYNGYLNPVSYRYNGSSPCEIKWTDPFGHEMKTTVEIVGDWLPHVN